MTEWTVKEKQVCGCVPKMREEMGLEYCSLELYIILRA